MWQFKIELSDLSFKYLFPNEYESLDSMINSKFLEYQRALEAAKQQLEEDLRNDPWLRGRLRSVHVVGRTKSIYSTFMKMQRHNCGIERIYDLVALRVVLNPERDPAQISAEAPPVTGTTTLRRDGSGNDYYTSGILSKGTHMYGGYGGTSEGTRDGEEEPSVTSDADNAMCYHVLGKVHAAYTPLPRTLKDYISSPKPNGYRSLHTTVLVGAQPLEVQIRTQAMHYIAEYGAAAHWAYKDAAVSLPWLQIIREWQDTYSAHEFMQLIREELLGTRVFVFTRNGRILNLARGATLRDAARHMSLPSRGYVPMLNGKAALHNTELSNGDIVAFEKSSRLLVERLRSRGYASDLRGALTTDSSGEGGGGFDGGSSDRLASTDGFRGVVESSGRPSRARTRAPGMEAVVEPRHMWGKESAQQTEPWLELSTTERTKRYLKRQGSSASGWHICSDCLPLPGDELLACDATEWEEKLQLDGAAEDGRENRYLGTIHCALGECPTLRKELEAGRRLVANARECAHEFHKVLYEQCEREGGLTASIIIFCADRKGMLVDVATAVTGLVNNILNVHTEITPGGTGAFKYEVTVQSRAQLEELMEAVRAVPDVIRVIRGKDYGQRPPPALTSRAAMEGGEQQGWPERGSPAQTYPAET